MTTSYVAVDLETTGIGAKREKITEIGMVKVVDGVVVETYHTMVNPHRKIPERIVELTGITDEMVKDAPGIEEVLPEVIAFCEGFPLLGHQIIFDYGFLTQAAVNMKLEFKKDAVDTLKLCRYLMPGPEKKNLGAACAYFGIVPETAHRALSDAMSTHLLYTKLMEQFGESRSDLFVEKPLIYKAKKERPATKRQKQHLQDLLKYHRIETTVHIDHMSGNEISRMIDKIIFTHGRIPEKG
ncbi:MAG: 3'-5' exonuclease [Lachnoclostridium sp.]|nr:3'-5' exonuclease [Lachnoclostridium sp.]